MQDRPFYSDSKQVFQLDLYRGYYNAERGWAPVATIETRRYSDEDAGSVQEKEKISCPENGPHQNEA